MLKNNSRKKKQQSNRRTSQTQRPLFSLQNRHCQPPLKGPLCSRHSPPSEKKKKRIKLSHRDHRVTAARIPSSHSSTSVGNWGKRRARKQPSPPPPLSDRMAERNCTRYPLFSTSLSVSPSFSTSRSVAIHATIRSDRPTK